MAVIALVLGAGFAAGLLLIAAGARRRPPRPPARVVAVSRESATRAVACLAAAALAGLVTGWPVGAVLAAAAAWTVPALWGGDRAQRQAIARTEAVAAWTEMLRDNLGAAAGLEQAILAAGQVPPA